MGRKVENYFFSKTTEMHILAVIMFHQHNFVFIKEKES